MHMKATQERGAICARKRILKIKKHTKHTDKEILTTSGKALNQIA